MYTSSVQVLRHHAATHRLEPKRVPTAIKGVRQLPEQSPPDRCPRTNAPSGTNVPMFDVKLTEKNFKSVSEVLWAFTDIVMYELFQPLFNRN